MDYSKVKFVKPSVDGFYVAKGNVYAFEFHENKGGKVINDKNRSIYILIEDCAHLSFNNWIPCDENGKELGYE